MKSCLAVARNVPPRTETMCGIGEPSKKGFLLPRLPRSNDRSTRKLAACYLIVTLGPCR